jgi:hypothetical protein
MPVGSRFISPSWFCANFGRDRGLETLMCLAVCPSQHHSTCCWHGRWDWGAPTSEEVGVDTFLQLCPTGLSTSWVLVGLGEGRRWNWYPRSAQSCGTVLLLFVFDIFELGALVYCNSEISCETANFFLSRRRKPGGASRYCRTVSYTGQHNAGIWDTYPCPEWDANPRELRNLVVQYCARLML